MLPHKGFRANSPSLCRPSFSLTSHEGKRKKNLWELGASALLPFSGLWRSWERA